MEVFTRRAAAATGAGWAPRRRRRPRLAGRPCSTNRTSRSPRSCSPCWARAASSTLLAFLERHAPDPVTRAVARLAAPGRGPPRRLRRRPPGAPGVRRTPLCAAGCAGAVERRHDALRDTAGLNAGRLRRPRGPGRRRLDARPPSRRGHRAVRGLQASMDEGRQHRLDPAGLPRRRGRRAVRPAHPQLHVTPFGTPQGVSARSRVAGGPRRTRPNGLPRPRPSAVRAAAPRHRPGPSSTPRPPRRRRTAAGRCRRAGPARRPPRPGGCAAPPTPPRPPRPA